MQNAAFAKRQLDWVYVPLQVDPGFLEDPARPAANDRVVVHHQHPERFWPHGISMPHAVLGRNA